MRIQNKIIKATLLKVIPGSEIEVARKIEEALSHQKNKFRIYRLFGNYDILVLFETPDMFQKGLGQAGVIPGITGSREFLCYSWQTSKNEGDSKTSFFTLSSFKHPLIAFSSFKINPLLNFKFGIEAESSFVSYLKHTKPQIHVLGTFGWSECILIYNSNSFEKLLDGMEDIISTIIEYSEPGRGIKRGSVAEKTLTMIGHDIEVSDPRTKSFILPLPERLRKQRLQAFFKIACKPRAMEILITKAIARFNIKRDKIKVRLGAFDLEFEIPLDTVQTLNDLLTELDGYRKDNYGNLIRTYTDIRYEGYLEKDESSNVDDDSKETVYIPPYVDLSNREAATILKIGSTGEEIVKTIYWCNNFIENDLLTEMYEDILLSVEQLKRHALRYKGNVHHNRELIIRLSKLQYALYERAQGAYVGIEEVPLGSVPFSAGIQRILKGLEVFPHTILKRFGKKWLGYCIAGYVTERYEHSVDIILVPTEVAFKSDQHWGITHEAMHALIHTAPDIFSFRNKRFQEALGIGSNDIEYRSTIWMRCEEILCDVLDFEICCPYEVKDYLDIVWLYLKDNIFDEERIEQLHAYLLRTFCVFVYDTFRVEGLYIGQGSALRFRNAYDTFTKTIINRLNDRQSTQIHKPETISNVLSEFHAIKGLLGAIRSLLKDLNLDNRRKRLNSENAILFEAYKKLKQGLILNGKEMLFADKLAWVIRKEGGKDLGVRGNIAFLLSLWDFYNRGKLGTDLDKVWVEDK